MRLAFALGWQGRAEHRIHNAIIARVRTVAFADIPYASAKRATKPSAATIKYPDGGDAILDVESLKQIVREWRDRRPIWQLPDADGTPGPNFEGATLAARHGSPAKLALYREIIDADAGNPAFEMIDKERLLAAVRVLPILPSHLAKQVHGAMASVIWLGRMEGEAGRARLRLGE